MDQFPRTSQTNSLGLRFLQREDRHEVRLTGRVCPGLVLYLRTGILRLTVREICPLSLSLLHHREVVILPLDP